MIEIVRRIQRKVFDRIMAGVSTRGYKRTNEPVGSEVAARGVVDLEVGRLARPRPSHPAPPSRS